MRIILALSPDSSSEAFLREVDEDLRRDQAQAFAKRYATIIAGGVLLFLAAIGGWLYWQDRQAKVAGADSETLTAAMDDIAAKRITNVGPALDKLAGVSEIKSQKRLFADELVGMLVSGAGLKACTMSGNLTASRIKNTGRLLPTRS